MAKNMTKEVKQKRMSKKEAVEKLMRRPMKPEEVLELQEMVRVVNARKWEIAQIKQNTAAIANGQVFANQMESMVFVLENAQQEYLKQKLVDCGYPVGTVCNVNFSTGEITVIEESNKFEEPVYES